MSNPYSNPLETSGKKIFQAANVFLRMEASGGILLGLAAILAIIVANSALYGVYDHILHDIYFRIGFDEKAGGFDFEIKKSILHWVNDGFMVIFFFLVGLELKREVKSGELSTRSRALLPAMAAVGGMVVPALIYYYINKDIPENLSGWAIPAATDIAFALGVLSLLGSRAPVRLKILLTAIAVIDDIGAILIIAFFYTSDLQVEPLMFGAVALVGLLILNLRNVVRTAPYIILGVILWVAVLQSGIHATLAGVVTALFIPVVSNKDPSITPCKTLEHALHPWVSFIILPVFAFANAGVPFDGMGFHSLFAPTTLGIILGLVIGKQIGIFSMLWIAVKTGLSPMPNGTNWTCLYAVSALCGIGFTMSLFIGGLAFDDLQHQASIRLGVLVASVISAVIGYSILRFTPNPEEKK